MFFRFRTKGIVIGKKDQGEADRVLVVYTEGFGKIKLFGKSIRRESSKLRSGSEPFALIELEFIEGRSRKILTDVRVIDHYPRTNSDLKKIALVGRIADDLDFLIKGEERDSKVWGLVQSSFDMIEAGKGSFAYHRFFWNLMIVLGYGPELYNCTQCRGLLNSTKLIFSPEEGGLVCALCRPKNSAFLIDQGIIKVIRALLRDDELEVIDEDSLWDISKRYLSLVRG